MKALVLGCGPAGLLAAHAAQLCGYTVTIVSKKLKSRIGGAQYLHHAIPELTPEEPEGWLRVDSVGTRQGYAEKVYGDSSAPVSWDHFVDEVDGQPIMIWDIVTMYDELWKHWEDKVIDGVVNSSVAMAGFAYGEWAEYDVVFSTIPATDLCLKDDHRFARQQIYAVPGFYDREVPGDVIMYNGDPEISWYRSSRIFSRGMTEYSGHASYIPNSMDGLWIKKPLATDCDCWEGRIMKVGRYGRWVKGDLVTDAFDVVYGVLDGTS